MLFVPKGYLPLLTAVDQLAGTRRSAGQTNDDRQNTARMEFRAELHSRSMLAMVISPSTGDAFAIRPQHWALEMALCWLEQGECLLTEDFVDPWSPELAGPGCWPSLLRGERATIFVSDRDLQRLMARQEAKQEAAPPRARKGRKAMYDWEDAMNFAKLEFENRGDYSDPQNAVDGWRSQADWARLVSSYMKKHNGGKEPPDSSVKSHLKVLLDSIRK